MERLRQPAICPTALSALKQSGRDKATTSQRDMIGTLSREPGCRRNVSYRSDAHGKKRRRAIMGHVNSRRQSSTDDHLSLAGIGSGAVAIDECGCSLLSRHEIRHAIWTPSRHNTTHMYSVCRIQ